MGTIAGWLEQLGLEQYSQAFAENDIDIDVIAELTDGDLKELGVSLGHRKKMLRVISGIPTEPEQPTSATNRPAPSSEAERRHLTIMFVDLVGSTALSGRLDPEDMRAVMTAYQNAVAGVITRYSGHVAKYMGDGVLCYFGWPRANEDDAERAVRAGLSIIQAIKDVKAPGNEAMSVRVGVATGLVVVGDLVGEGAAQEEAVVGDTPNLAARLQGLANPGEMVVAAATRQLLGDMFELNELGQQELKGIAGKTNSYVVTGERAAESRFAARASGEVAEMVGRDHELALLKERWNRAKNKEGQLVLLTGEAGIGKSRISRAMIDALAGEDHIRLNYQCSPYHTDTALYPAIQQISQAAHFAPSDTDGIKLDKLESLSIDSEPALIASLLGLDGLARYGPLDLTPQRQRSKTLEALASQIVALSRQKPVLINFEDAHWIDATTLELLDLCLDQIASARILMLVTARPTFEHGFGGHPIVTKLALNRLGREQVTAIINKITGGKTLPVELIDEISNKTDGVPLFVEELTKAVLESGELKEHKTSYELIGTLSQLAIPATLHDSLMARLDRLQPVKEVAQSAACIGREFGYTSLSAIVPQSDVELEDALNQLIAAELIFRRGLPPEATYIFKHALVRDAAYESLLKSRRQAIHNKLVSALETQENAAPEILGYHCSQSGQLDKAIVYWRQAGIEALERPAHTEAVSHLTTAAGLISELETSHEWIDYELELQIQLAQVYLAKSGYGSTEAALTYARAEELLRQTNRPELLVPVLYGLWIGHYLRAEHNQGYDMVRKLVAEVDRLGEPVPRLVAHRMCAATEILLGKHPEARKNLETALALYEPDLLTRFAEQFAQEPGIQIRSYFILNLWLLGYPGQVAQHVSISQDKAAELDHVNTTCYGALHWVIYAFMGQNDELLRQSNDTMYSLGEQHGLATWQIYGLFGDLLIKSKAGDLEALENFAQAEESYTSEGNWLFVPFYKTEQIKELLRHGQVDAAMKETLITKQIVERTDERWYLPELLRVEGTIHLANGQTGKAEECFQNAIAEARSQSAKSWELRAAASLALLWADGGDKVKARDLLQPVYEWFTEGFDTPNLKDAKALLDALT